MKILIKISIAILLLSTMFFTYVQPNKNAITVKSIFFTEEVLKGNVFASESKYTQNNDALNNFSFFKKLIQNRAHTLSIIPIINKSKINLINDDIYTSKIVLFSKY
jgi:hypothetical protein